jgi:hypothetical protein
MGVYDLQCGGYMTYYLLLSDVGCVAHEQDSPSRFRYPLKFEIQYEWLTNLQEGNLSIRCTRLVFVSEAQEDARHNQGPQLQGKLSYELPYRSHAQLPYRSNAHLPYRSNAQLPYRSNAHLPYRSNAELPYRSNAQLPYRSNAQLP